MRKPIEYNRAPLLVALQDSGMTQQELALNAGCSRATVQAIMTGKGDRFALPRLLKVCLALEVDPKEVVKDALAAREDGNG